MNHLTRWPVRLTVLAAVVAAGFPLFAQQTTRGYRRLAPGVLQTVDPSRQIDEAFSRHDLVQVLAAEPPGAEYDWARDLTFATDVWTLEFKFKPVRMVWVDVPQPSGAMQRKLIWYMVYSVTNRRIEETTYDLDALGDSNAESLPSYGVMRPTETDHGKFMLSFSSERLRFVPQFLLEGRDSIREDAGFNKVYIDRIIPIAFRQIAEREDPNRQFYSSVDISQAPIGIGKTAWGIATWEDVDSKIDRFSVYVKGLTNAYQWADDASSYREDAPLDSYHRQMVKTLKLNFWRPGDEYGENEREIRYGVPGGIDYEWVYLVEKGIAP